MVVSDLVVGDFGRRDSVKFSKILRMLAELRPGK